MVLIFRVDRKRRRMDWGGRIEKGSDINDGRDENPKREFEYLQTETLGAFLGSQVPSLELTKP